jgi:hypothetical protein
MSKKFFAAEVSILLILLSAACAAQTQRQKAGEDAGFMRGKFAWTTGRAVVKPVKAGGEEWISVKDPSIVRYGDRWHLFCTVRGQKRSHAVVYLAFDEFNNADKAKQHVLSCHEGYFCAPQVFYFSPHKRWYLICQASDESWQPKYQAAYSTTTDISAPDSWAKLKPLGAQQANGKSGLDFWIICDDTRAHLFFTTLDGCMWREETALEKFPQGWSAPSLSIQADIFEAGHIYRLTNEKLYLTVVEAQGGHGWRYFKAYLAESLDGKWRPLAAERDNSFASMKNVHQKEGRLTDSISHGELLRSGYDQRLEVNAEEMRFLFQGVMDREREGKNYGQIPWRLGILQAQQ